MTSVPPSTATQPPTMPELLKTLVVVKVQAVMDMRPPTISTSPPMMSWSVSGTTSVVSLWYGDVKCGGVRCAHHTQKRQRHRIHRT